MNAYKTATTPAIMAVLTFWWASCAPLEPSSQSLERGSKAVNQNDSILGSGDVLGDEVKGKTTKTAIEEQNTLELQLTSFKESVYPVTKNCATCHAATQAPFFAANDPAAALEAILVTQKVDFKEPAKSRLVLRLNPEQHNCWSGDCNADSASMLAAIEDWIAKQAAAGQTPEEEDLANATLGLVFGEAPLKEAESDPGTVVFYASDYGAITAPLTMMNDDPDGEAATYLVAPPPAAIVQPAGVGGQATYNFEIEQDGTYAIWARIKAPAGNANSFNISVNGGAFQAWNTAITMADWAWDSVKAANVATPTTFNLTAGNHTIVVKQREAGTRINTIAISDQLANFNGAAVTGQVTELRFPLFDLIGKNAELLVDATEFDEANKAVMLRNLRIETTESVRVKDVMPLINGKFNPQHATFRLVDQTVNAPGGNLSGSALIIIGENGWMQDEISFSFGEIE